MKVGVVKASELRSADLRATTYLDPTHDVDAEIRKCLEQLARMHRRLASLGAERLRILKGK